MSVPEAPKTDQPSIDSNPSLASIGVMVASLVSALGLLTLTGTVGRVQREDPEAFSVALGFLLFAGAFWVAAATFTAPKKAADDRTRMDKTLRGLAIIFGVSGLMLGLSQAVHTADNEPRPKITPSLSDDGSKLTTEVKASGLPTDHRLAFRVDLLHHRDAVGQIYEAYIGPDGDGNVDQTITVPLPKEGFTEIGVKAYSGAASPGCDEFSEMLANHTAQENAKAEKEARERREEEDQYLPAGTACVILTLPEYAVRSRP
jgi:hypothetical protein